MDAGYLSQQISTIVGQLHDLFDEIGVPNHDRETREEEVRPTTRVAAHTPLATCRRALHVTLHRRLANPS